MADNSARTPGSGETIRTLDKTTYKTPVSALDVGGSGSESLVTATNGLPTKAENVTSSTDIALASTTTSAQLIAANTARKGMVLTNTDSNSVYIYYGTTAVATKFTVIIPPGALWEMPWPIYTGRIDAIWAGNGTGSLIGSEL